MRDWQVQENFLRALDATTGTVTAMQRLRAASELDRMQVFSSDESLGDSENLLGWVRDALGHFWGGPRLTDSPLMNFRIVREAAAEYDGNQANALRAVLRKAIDQVKPDGDRRFTAEWILYNILEMKFVEGKKVREVALRLAMSEADLYRKQRVAIEAVARAIAEMEGESHPPKPPEPSP